MTGVCLLILVGGVAVAQNPSLSCAPIGDTAWLEVRHPDLGDGALQVRLPEHIVTLKGMVGQQVVWEQVGEGRWRFRWNADATLKEREQTDFRGEVVAGQDELAFTFTIANPTDSPWSGERYNAFDVMAGALPMFHDPAGERTYVYVKDRFVSVRKALQGQFSEDLTGWMLMAADPQNPRFREYTERLMARVSQDGQWVLAIASDSGTGVTFNLQPATSCLHQNRTWTPLRPHEEKTLRGKVYLFKGSLEELMTRFRRDKAAWAQAEATGGAGAAEAKPAAASQQPRYMATVWAAPTSPKTLERLRAMRPQDLPEHPLATWVADRLARDLERTPSSEQVEEALGAFSQQNGFFLRNDASGLWVSNGRTGLAFLPPEQGCGIASLYHLGTGTECVFRSPPAHAPWRLLVLEVPDPAAPPVQALFPGRGSDLSKARELDGAGVTPNVKVVIADHAATVTVDWTPVRVPEAADAFAVHATMILEANSELVRWHVDVRRLGQSAVHRLMAVRFPLIRGLGALGEHDMVWSMGCGCGLMERATPVAWGDDSYVYPASPWSVQFLTMGFGPATLYMACHDSEGCTKAYRFAPGDVFYFTHISPSPVEWRLPYEVALGPVSGDWFDAAKLYRRWATQQAWCGQGPLAQRVAEGTVSQAMLDRDLWVRPDWGGDRVWNSGVAQVAANLDWLQDGKLPDGSSVGPGAPADVAPNIGVWWYGWNQEQFDTQTPQFTARPEAGPEFAREVEQGLVVMPYTQSGWWDVQTKSFQDGGRAAAAKLLDGSLRVQNYAAPLGLMCLSQPLCQDTTSRLAGYVAGLGADAVYLDTFPGYAECYDASHAHPLGAGGDWWVKSVRRILERIKREQGAQFGITMEFIGEPYLDLCDVQMDYNWVVCEDCPLLPAIYSGYAVLSGASTHGDYPDDIVSFRIKLGRRFLWGSQLGRGMFSEYLLDAQKAAFARQVVLLRARVRDGVTYGELLRPPAWTAHVPTVVAQRWMNGTRPAPAFRYDAVECALWRAPDGEVTLLLVNYDDQNHEVTFRVGQWWERGARKVYTVAAYERRLWLDSVTPGAAVRLVVPGAAVMALRFSPD